MGQSQSQKFVEEAVQERGVKCVALVHGLASCALTSKPPTGVANFLCDNCSGGGVEHLVYVSIRELVQRPQIVLTLGLEWESTFSQDGIETMKTSDGYENANVSPVEGLAGIRSLNPGRESNMAPINLWHELIEHLTDFNLIALNYDWRRWGDLIYIEDYRESFRSKVERAVRISRQPLTMVGHSLGAQVITYMLGFFGPEWTAAHISDTWLISRLFKILFPR